ncbi:hypothetical protein GCM10008012_58350 [Rhizobium anhuiense]|nr:hypothetical protein GCM10008012_58350 [Rhizobium anhuiense]
MRGRVFPILNQNALSQIDYERPPRLLDFPGKGNRLQQLQDKDNSCDRERHGQPDDPEELPKKPGHAQSTKS